MQPSAECGRHARADLYRRPLASQRVARADTQHASDEFTERDSRRDAALVQMERCLGLRNATATHAREDPREQDAGCQTGECWDEENPDRGRIQTEEQSIDAINPEREENRRQARSAGVPMKNLRISGLCTVSDNRIFYSFRKEKEAAGRMISFIRLS